MHSRRLVILACMLSLSAAIAAGVIAQQKGKATADPAAEWKVGLASVNITPRWGVLMAGYASRKDLSEGVHDELFAKAMALEDFKGNRGVIVTADLIGFRAVVAERICDRVIQRTGLSRGQILLNATHTHAGPMVGVDTSGQSGYGDEYPVASVDATQRYVKELEDKVVALIEQALANLKPARLSMGSGVAHVAMNRREFTPNGVRLGVNARGLVDRSVPTIRIETREGKMIGVLFGYACHNTTLGGRNLQISGDYAGPAQTYVENHYPGVQAMFMLGCAGDANPYPRGTFEDAQRHAEHLGDEVCRVLEENLTPIRGPLTTTFARVDLPLRKVPPRQEIERIATSGPNWDRFFATRALKMLDAGLTIPTHYNAPMAVWQFGDDLTFVGISGEVVVDYVRLVEDAIGPLNLWVAGYCNDVYGYLPSARVLREGGYETRGIYHGSIGVFSEEAEPIVIDTIKKLAAQAGRTMPQ